jgi:hypothetical protein
MDEMKIIGEAGENLILEANRNEVAKIAGFKYICADKCPTLRVGHEVEVSAIYEQWDQLTSNKRNLAEIKRECETILGSVKKITPIVEAAVAP